jgi:hypothetical protein
MKRIRLTHILLTVVLAIVFAGSTACVLDESSYYINGAIDGTAYEKSGFLLAVESAGVTQLTAAASMIDWGSGTGFWYIVIPGTSTGTYTDLDGATVEYQKSAGDVYMTVDNISISVTTYTGSEVAGSFTGDLRYSIDVIDYPAQGEFRLEF